MPQIASTHAIACLCIRLYTCSYICLHTGPCACPNSCLYVHTHVHTLNLVHVCTRVQMSVCISIHKSIHVPLYLSIHMSIHMHMHMSIHVYTHFCISQTRLYACTHMCPHMSTHMSQNCGEIMTTISQLETELDLLHEQLWNEKCVSQVQIEGCKTRYVNSLVRRRGQKYLNRTLSHWAIKTKKKQRDRRVLRLAALKSHFHAWQELSNSRKKKTAQLAADIGNFDALVQQEERTAEVEQERNTLAQQLAEVEQQRNSFAEELAEQTACVKELQDIVNAEQSALNESARQQASVHSRDARVIEELTSRISSLSACNIELNETAEMAEMAARFAKVEAADTMEELLSTIQVLKEQLTAAQQQRFELEHLAASQADLRWQKRALAVVFSAWLETIWSKKCIQGLIQRVRLRWQHQGLVMAVDCWFKFMWDHRMLRASHTRVAKRQQKQALTVFFSAWLQSVWRAGCVKELIRRAELRRHHEGLVKAVGSWLGVVQRRRRTRVSVRALLQALRLRLCRSFFRWRCSTSASIREIQRWKLVQVTAHHPENHRYSMLPIYCST